jgi:hypothetical protein
LPGPPPAALAPCASFGRLAGRSEPRSKSDTLVDMDDVGSSLRGVVVEAVEEDGGKDWTTGGLGAGVVTEGAGIGIAAEGSWI